MIIDVSGIKDTKGATISVTLNDTVALPIERLEGTQKVHVSGSITAANVGDHISVFGDVSTDVAVDCDRCLSEFSYNIKASVDDSYYDKAVLTARQEQSLREQGVSFRVYEGDRLDVSPSVIEALILEFPIKLVCRDDCKGLCPVCGQDLNNGSCSCVVDDVDPRMLKLKELLKTNETED